MFKVRRKCFKLLCASLFVYSGLSYSYLYSLISASTLANQQTLANLLNAINTANNYSLIDFNNNILNSSAFNAPVYAKYPAATNSIYTKTKFFFDARNLQDATYLRNLYNFLSSAKNKYFYDSTTEAANVAMWYTTIGNEISLLTNFITVLNICTTPSLLLSNVVQLTSYNKVYYQNWPSIVNCIFTQMDNFFRTRTINLQTNINYLQNLLDLLNAASDKSFLTNVQNSVVTSYMATVSAEKTNLDSLLYNFQNSLSANQNNPILLDQIITKNSNYAQPYLRNYPTQSFSFYAIMKNLFMTRETQFVQRQSFLADLQIALKNAGSSVLLDAAQQADFVSWYNIITLQDIPLISRYVQALQAASDATSLNKIVADSTNNRVYFQNFPTVGNSIFTKTQNLFNQRTQTSSVLTSLQTLLTNMQNKNFLNSSQLATINTWLSTVVTEINRLGSTVGTINAPPAVSTPISTITYPTTDPKSSTADTFVFDPSVYGQDKVVYNSTKWVAPYGYCGNFAVLFKARGQKDIYVQLSPSPGEIFGNVYNLVIGGDNNTTTWVRNFTTALGQIICSKVSGSSVIITGGLPGDGSIWGDYWIKILNNSDLHFGKGTQVGVNEVAHWTIAQPTSAPVQYIAFGSASSVIQFSNVQIIEVLQDRSVTVKSNFILALEGATNIQAVLNIVNNTDYNQSYLQNLPQESSSIYTLLKNLFSNRIDNFNRDTSLLKNLLTTVSDLQNLLNISVTKDFLTVDQKNDISTCINTLSTEKNLLTQFTVKFSSILTIESLIDFVKISEFNNSIFIDYPNVFNSIYSKVKDFVNIRTLVINKNATYLNNLKNLIASVKDKNFLTTTENSDLASIIPTIDREIVALTTKPTQAVTAQVYGTFGQPTLQTRGQRRDGIKQRKDAIRSQDMYKQTTKPVIQQTVPSIR